MIASFAAVGVTALLLTLAYTDAFASFNQATYLLDPLHRALPELYRRDWFISETPPYLPAFGWVVRWLFEIDPEGPAAIVTAHVVVMCLTYAAMFRLVSSVLGDWRVFVLLAAFVAITFGRSMGGNYLVVGYLQPSSLATLCWIYAMAALVRRRYLACGIALAVAGALHTNFLVLGVGLFAGAALISRTASVRDFSKLLGPQLVVLAWFLPLLISAAGPSDEAVRILVEFHAAHYAPDRLVRWIPVIAAWQAAAYAARRLLADDQREVHTLWCFSLVSFAVATVSALVMLVPAFEALTQARWSRVAPFGQLACQTLVAVALVRHVLAPKPLVLVRRLAIAATFIIAIIVTSRWTRQLPLLAAIVGSVGVAIVVVSPWQRVRQLALASLIVVAVAFALWASPRGRGLTTSPHATAGELALAHWAREQTAVDALFVTPPGLGRFRLLARRAVIVDTKSPPLRPDLLVAWYRRLCTMVRIPEARTYGALERRYAELSASELVDVARSFGADYIVVTAPIELGAPPVFAHSELVVYRVAP